MKQNRPNETSVYSFLMNGETIKDYWMCALNFLVQSVIDEN